MTTAAPRNQYPPSYNPIKYRRCHERCTVRHHRTLENHVRCIWRRALWIQGEGRFASVTYCGGTTVVLSPTLADARVWKQQADHFGCGGRCRGKAAHKIVEVIYTAPVVK